MKSHGLEEIPVFDISEKTVNGIETKSSDDERLASGIFLAYLYNFMKILHFLNFLFLVLI